MGRTARDKRENAPKPVKHIELSEKNKKLRLIAAILFLCIGVGFIIYGVMSGLAPETGWNRISGSVPQAEQFVFQYNFDEGGVNYSTANKQITALYDEAMGKCFKLFSEDTEYEDVTNLYLINREPNITQEVDGLLYNAFAEFEKDGGNYLYLAPIYNRYRNIFDCSNDTEIVNYEPSLNPEVKAEFDKLAEFAADRNSVKLELLGDNKVRLTVSEEYLKFAEEQGITDFIGFTRFTNAFIVDFVADVMEQNGFTACNIVSYDGYTRNLDNSGAEYALNIFDRVGNNIFPGAIWRYSGKKSIVSMRNYPLNSYDTQRFYEASDGKIYSDYFNQQGEFKTAANNLICYSEKSCAETALKTAEIFSGDTLEKSALEKLSGIYSIFCENYTVIHTEKDAVITDYYNKDGITYK